MSAPKDRVLDPDAEVTLPNGDRIRPDRFGSDGEGMTITPPGGDEPDDEDGFEYLDADTKC